MCKNNFRINCKGLFLKYDHFLEKSDIKFNTKKNFQFKLWHEQGETDYKHSHVILYFPNKIDTRNPRFFDIIYTDEKIIHPNIKRILTKSHFNNLLVYDKNSKKREKNLYSKVIFNNLDPSSYEWNGTLRREIQAKKHWRDVLNDDNISTTLRDKNWLNWGREIFNNKPMKILEKYSKANLKPWQTTILNILLRQDDRKVLWIWSKGGNVGKSFLTNYLLHEKDAFFCNGGRLCDIAEAYEEQDIAVFDLPKSQGEFTPYKAMECLKDGRLFCPKYHSRMKIFEPAKVIIFSNSPPDTTKMSIDRFLIYNVDGELLTPKPLNIKVGVSVGDIYMPPKEFTGTSCCNLNQEVGDKSPTSIGILKKDVTKIICEPDVLRAPRHFALSEIEISERPKGKKKILFNPEIDIINMFDINWQNFPIHAPEDLIFSSDEENPD